jgi:hypothetical protein
VVPRLPRGRLLVAGSPAAKAVPFRKWPNGADRE